MALPLPSLTSLRAFEAAARLCSFKLAAEDLAVTATAISHRIRVLEEYLGCPLFLRRPRAVELTPEGRMLFAAVSRGLETIAAAIIQIRRPARATVGLSVTPAFAAKWLVPRLPALQAAQPEIDLHLHASNTPVDLNAGAAELAIRYGNGPYPGIVASRLLQDRFAPVASPRLLQTVGHDPERWPLIHFDWQRPPRLELSWRAWESASGRNLPQRDTGIRYSEESHAIQAAIAGQGVALVSLLLVEQELHLGMLQIAGSPTLEAMAYHLLQRRQPPISAAAATIADWLSQQARCQRR